MYYRKKTFYESKKHFIMAVPVMRYQRYKDLSDKSSPQKYYLKQEPGSSKTATIASIAKEIEITGALSAEDVTHVMQAFVRQLKKSLVEGNKVKVDGLGTFYITLTSAGTETEKECTVKGIRRVSALPWTTVCDWQTTARLPPAEERTMCRSTSRVKRPPATEATEIL